MPKNRNPEYLKRKNRKRTLKQYGLTPEDYDRIVGEQANCCGICGKPPKEGKHLRVDGDADTLEVFGLLCTRCSLGLKMHFRHVSRYALGEYLARGPVFVL